MGLNIKKLAGIPAAKFDAIGDSAEGTVEAAEMFDDANKPDSQVPVITVVDEDGDKRKLWVRTGLIDAINTALDEAGAAELEVGAWLKVTYTGDKTLQRTGRTMKLYAASYLPEPGQGAFA